MFTCGVLLLYLLVLPPPMSFEVIILSPLTHLQHHFYSTISTTPFLQQCADITCAQQCLSIVHGNVCAVVVQEEQEIEHDTFSCVSFWVCFLCNVWVCMKTNPPSHTHTCCNPVINIQPCFLTSPTYSGTTLAPIHQYTLYINTHCTTTYQLGRDSVSSLLPVLYPL